MAKFVIFGSTGMIGSAVTKYLTQKNHEIIEVNRNGSSAFGDQTIRFDVCEDDIFEIANNFPENSTILNFIGLIRHQIDETNPIDAQRAIEINSLFPFKLDSAAKSRNSRVIQIGTDCIYSGNSGSYVDGAKPDPIDLYGVTKSLGEFKSSNLMIIRVSSVGHEKRHHVELMDWVLNHPPGSIINGYQNHFWNGITSLHVGKIVEAVVLNEQYRPGITHLSPSNRVTKFDLVKEIARLGGRSDLIIRGIDASNSIDRTLSTNFPDVNSNLWRAAGYQSIPTIDALLAEYFKWCAV